MKTLMEIQERINSAIAALLLTDAEMATTFLDLADTTRSAENRRRRLREANKAYWTILGFLPRVEMTEQQRAALETRLGRLHRRLSGAAGSAGRLPR